MLSACPLLKVVYLQQKTLLCLSKTCVDAISTFPLFGRNLWETAEPLNIISSFLPKSFHLSLCGHADCPLSWKSTCLCVLARVRACMYEHVLFTSCFALWSSMSSVNTLFPACIKIQLSSHSSSQPGSETGSLQAAPVGKVCCLCAHKHCHSVKLPSSSKGYRIIRYTGEINSSAPEKSCTQLPHLLVRITH